MHLENNREKFTRKFHLALAFLTGLSILIILKDHRFRWEKVLVDFLYKKFVQFFNSPKVILILLRGLQIMQILQAENFLKNQRIKLGSLLIKVVLIYSLVLIHFLLSLLIGIQRPFWIQFSGNSLCQNTYDFNLWSILILLALSGQTQQKYKLIGYGLVFADRLISFSQHNSFLIGILLEMSLLFVYYYLLRKIEQNFNLKENREISLKSFLFGSLIVFNMIYIFTCIIYLNQNSVQLRDGKLVNLQRCLNFQQKPNSPRKLTKLDELEIGINPSLKQIYIFIIPLSYVSFNLFKFIYKKSNGILTSELIHYINQALLYILTLIGSFIANQIEQLRYTSCIFNSLLILTLTTVLGIFNEHRYLDSFYDNDP